MKKLFYLLAAVMLLFTFVSCDEKELAPGGESGVSWDISNISKTLANKDAGKYDVNEYPECSDLDESYVFVVINGVDYKIQLTGLTGQTEVLKLPAGNYTVTEFVVYSADDTAIWSMPMTGSLASQYYGLTGLPFDFSIKEFVKQKKEVDVVCYNPSSYELFGYGWFAYTKYEENTLCFFGDVCTKFYDDYHEKDSPYFGQNYDGYDFPAIFDIAIYRGESQVAYESNIAWQGSGSPLCVKYLDNPIVDEHFSFEIFLHMPDGSKESVYIQEFDDGENSGDGFGGEDGVFDFSVGECDSQGNNDVDLVLPSYLPLPETVSFMINGALYGDGAYQRLYLDGIGGDYAIANTLPGAFLLGWCGAKDDKISRNIWYEANVYSSLNVSKIPAKYASYKWGALNWLINHKSGYTPKQIQAAIWHITNGTAGNSLSFSAMANQSYKPKVGEFAIVLFDAIEFKEESEIQLFIVKVDP